MLYSRIHIVHNHKVITLFYYPGWVEGQSKSDTITVNPNTFAGLVGKVRKKLYPKEDGREGGEKKRAQRARRARGSNLGPVAC